MKVRPSHKRVTIIKHPYVYKKNIYPQVFIVSVNHGMIEGTKSGANDNLDKIRK